MTRRITDLSHPIRPGMVTFPRPWHQKPELEQLGRIEEVGRSTGRLLIGTHTGTHLDAPAHFLPGGATVEKLDLDALLGPCRILNLSDLPEGTAITPELLQQHLGAQVPDRLVLRFDWSGRYIDEKFYNSHPYLTVDAAKYLAENGARLIGSDTPQLDAPPDLAPQGGPDSPVHKILLGYGVILLEYLRNLDMLSSREVDLIVMPLNIVGADGAPVRCVAVEHLD